MRLHVTDHAFVRMADWHPVFSQFVPTKFPLDAENAQKVLNGLSVFVASLEAGRPSCKPEDLSRKMALKYRHARHFFIYDRDLQDLYIMVLDGPGLVLVTVTSMERRSCAIIDEPRPNARFDDVFEIEVPYALSPEVDIEEFRFMKTPSGRELVLTFNPSASMKGGPSRMLAAKQV